MKRITEQKLDTEFSKYIRLRDRTCQYPLRNALDYHAGSLQNSHFYGRSARSVRYDEENCDAVCGRHHQFLEGRKNAEYLWWKTEQLGKKRFGALRKRYVTLKQWKEHEKQQLLDRLLTAVAALQR